MTAATPSPASFIGSRCSSGCQKIAPGDETKAHEPVVGSSEREPRSSTSALSSPPSGNEGSVGVSSPSPSAYPSESRREGDGEAGARQTANVVGGGAAAAAKASPGAPQQSLQDGQRQQQQQQEDDGGEEEEKEATPSAAAGAGDAEHEDRLAEVVPGDGGGDDPAPAAQVTCLRLLSGRVDRKKTIRDGFSSELATAETGSKR